jgi:hypothetical protein
MHVRYIAAVLIACTAVLGVPTGPVYADTADDQFIGSLNALGISGDPGALIGAAHAVCDTNASGNTMGHFGVMSQAVSAGVPYGMMHQFYTASMRAYCPNVLHAIGQS